MSLKVIVILREKRLHNWLVKLIFLNAIPIDLFFIIAATFKRQCVGNVAQFLHIPNLIIEKFPIVPHLSIECFQTYFRVVNELFFIFISKKTIVWYFLTNESFHQYKRCNTLWIFIVLSSTDKRLQPYVIFFLLQSLFNLFVLYVCFISFDQFFDCTLLFIYIILSIFAPLVIRKRQ